MSGRCSLFQGIEQLYISPQYTTTCVSIHFLAGWIILLVRPQQMLGLPPFPIWVGDHPWRTLLFTGTPCGHVSVIVCSVGESFALTVVILHEIDSATTKKLDIIPFIYKPPFRSDLYSRLSKIEVRFAIFRFICNTSMWFSSVSEPFMAVTLATLKR